MNIKQANDEINEIALLRRFMEIEFEHFRFDDIEKDRLYEIIQEKLKDKQEIR